MVQFQRYRWLTAIFIPLVSIAGCGPSRVAPEHATNQATAEKVLPIKEGQEHEHKPGTHGGLILSLGRDSYHVEALFENTGSIRLFTLGQDETRVIDIPAKELRGYVKLDSEAESRPLVFAPEPQPGDSDGRTSLFVAQLPEPLIGRIVEVTVPNVAIDGERFRLAFTNADLVHQDGEHGTAAMPKKVNDDEEQRLYLEPGGHYTSSDIEANGNVTPYEKYRGIASAHDMNPKPGDRICPITETKANPKIVWVVGGKGYQFCCPPCIDEFVQKAKAGGDALPEPESFTQPEQSP